MPTSQVERLGHGSGDILKSYEGTCLYEPSRRTSTRTALFRSASWCFQFDESAGVRCVRMTGRSLQMDPTAYAVASLQKPQSIKPLQLFRRGCGWILYSARAAVAETCRRCCSDNAESAAHRISTVQFAPQAHRASLVGSHQHGGGPEPCNGPCSATGCAAAQSPRRGHVITQHGLIATGPLAGPQLRLHRTQGSDRSQAQVTHRAIATAQSLRTPGI